MAGFPVAEQSGFFSLRDMKPDPPPYPRPVPSIDFDDYPILPGTIVYTNDQEPDENARAAKRRRVEANANAYLRGEGLFILSAGLRGPFNAGWRNPWATKNNKRKQVPNTDESPAKRARLLPNNLKQAHRTTASVTSEKKPQSIPAQENPFEKTIRSSEPPTHDEKVESWLRRNSALPQDSFAVPTSPTPKKRLSGVGTNQSSKLHWTPTKQRITVNSQDVRAPLQQPVSRVVDSFDTVRPPGSQPARTHNKLQHILHSDDRLHRSHQSDGQSSGHRHRRKDSNSMEHVRAEEAIINLKRRSEEPTYKDVGARPLAKNPGPEIQKQLASGQSSGTKPLGSTVSAVLPLSASVGVENHAAPKTATNEANEINASGKQADAPEIKLKKLDASVDEQLQTNQHNGENDVPQAVEPSVTNGTSVPFYSTAVSEVQSAKFLPSAQHKPELQTSTSNISSGALLPDLIAGSKNIAAGAENSLVSNGKADTGVAFSRSSQQQQTSEHLQTKTPDKAVATVDERANQGKSSSRQNTPRPANQDVAAAAKSPAREPNGHVRMSQTSLDGSFVRSPTSVRRNRSNKTAKKASFAAEPSFTSSHGSIKSVLKVQKADVGEKAQKFTPPPLSFSKSVEMDTSVEEARALKDANSQGASKNNSPVEVWKVPRSILKSKSTQSSAAAALASAMLSPRNREGSSPSKASNQERQPSGQNGVLPRQQEEDFDMEGALDDLGSFLSTWDAEKESLHAM